MVVLFTGLVRNEWVCVFARELTCVFVRRERAEDKNIGINQVLYPLEFVSFSIFYSKKDILFENNSATRLN